MLLAATRKLAPWLCLLRDQLKVLRKVLGRWMLRSRLVGVVALLPLRLRRARSEVALDVA